MPNCHVALSNEQNKFSVDEAKFEEISCKMLNYLANDAEITSLSKLNSYDLSKIALNIDILICDDAKIREINKQYRNKDSVTDVLSFALFADSEENRIITDNQIFLGQIIISAETAQRQADEDKKSLEEEIIFLLSHGILHLMGFDHQDEESLEFMLELTRIITSSYEGDLAT